MNGPMVHQARKKIAAFRSHRLSRCLFGLFLISTLCNHDAQVFVSGFFLSSIATKVRPTVSRPAPSQLNKSQAKIRIRTSQDSDIKSIAEMLSAAIVNKNDVSNSGLSQFTNWKVKMDQLWAKADIEALLRVRLEAIQEGKSTVARVSDLYNTSGDENAVVAATSRKDQLHIMWKTSERLRKCIQKASSETGEDNIWRRHNFAKAPSDPSWLNHLQMSALDVESGQVVGFCEVAMLSNPLSVANDGNNDDEYDDDDDDEICNISSLFAPAITNLATALQYRRRGIASRMLCRAERFVQRKWGYNRLGLYVEKENKAAVTLYQSLGYQPVTTCDGGDQLGELWYMVRELTPIIQEQEEAKRGKGKRLQTPPKAESTMQAI